MAKSFGAVPGVSTITGLASEIEHLTDSIRGFVAALAPSIALEFSQALRDLSATIGSAFTGALNVLSSFVREIGGVLMPVMQRLEPVFRTFANVFGNQLLGAVKLVAAVLDALVPILQAWADTQNEINKFLLDLVSIVVVVIRVLKDVMGALFGGDLKDTVKSFVDILRQTVKALITFAATLAVFAGFRDTVKAFADGLAKEAKEREERAAGLRAAGTNPQITDIANILRQQQLAAFTAAGGGAAREKTDVEWLKEIAAAVKDTAATKKSFQEAVSDWWKNEVVGGNAGILGKVLNFIDSISAKVREFFNRAF